LKIALILAAAFKRPSNFNPVIDNSGIAIYLERVDRGDMEDRWPVRSAILEVTSDIFLSWCQDTPGID